MDRAGKIVAVGDGKRCQESKRMKMLRKNQGVYRKELKKK